MRVALLSAEYPPAPGGVGDYTRCLGSALQQQGVDVVVVTSARATGYGPPTRQPLPVEELQIAAWDWRTWPAVIAALDRTRPDLLHIQYQTGAYGMHPAINLLPWRLRALAPRPRVVVTAHDLLLPYLLPKASVLRHLVTRRLLDDADAAVVTNDADAAQVRSWRSAAATHLQIIAIGSNIAIAPPPGYDRAHVRQRIGTAGTDILIAHFGLISRSKGLDTLLDALAQLPSHIRLLVIGDESPAPHDRAFAAEIRRRIEREAFDRRVIITGHCDETEVSAYLLAADLAVLPFTDGASFRRGSLLATLAHGLPTITTFPTYTPGARSTLPHLSDSVHALLVPPNDPRSLSAAIARLADDASLRARLGAAGRAIAQQFSWEAIASQHRALYSALTTGVPRAACP